MRVSHKMGSPELGRGARHAVHLSSATAAQWRGSITASAFPLQVGLHHPVVMSMSTRFTIVIHQG